jgi:alpha-beta hydrolase superfamily lysophospholipase
LKSRVLRLLILLLVLYAGLCLVLYLMQDRMMFPMAGIGRGQTLPEVRGVEIEWLTLEGGTRVRMAVARRGQPKAWVVFFCGNGQDLRSGVHWAEVWRAYGNATVVPEYPGYGDSEGTPSTQSLDRMARAAGDFARAAAARDGVPLIVAGASLGS